LRDWDERAEYVGDGSAAKDEGSMAVSSMYKFADWLEVRTSDMTESLGPELDSKRWGVSFLGALHNGEVYRVTWARQAKTQIVICATVRPVQSLTAAFEVAVVTSSDLVMIVIIEVNDTIKAIADGRMQHAARSRLARIDR
jgi:2-C-methyl-D-erythritol 4-phosphate cytidylyltransferase